MVIVAHPDDADFGPAATAARWIDAGSAGWLVCCTSGDAGRRGPDTRPARAGRAARGRAAGGGRDRRLRGGHFLHQPDGALANDLALREQLVREIRTFRPDAVLAVDPETLFYGDGGVNHTDHRAAGIGGGRRRLPGRPQPDGVPVARPDGLRRPRVRRLYLFWSNQPTAWVDVTATIERKIAALRAHASQIRHPEGLGDRIREWAREEGEAIGVAAAEALRVVVIEDDEDEGPG